MTRVRSGRGPRPRREDAVGAAEADAFADVFADAFAGFFADAFDGFLAGWAALTCRG
jgi:hypothetical protein